jgi:hypothetical protein
MVSVRDVAMSGNKDEEHSKSGGISGYRIPMWKHKKQPQIEIVKSNIPTYFDKLVSSKQYIPASNKYNTSKDNVLDSIIHYPMNKSPRVSFV